MGRVPVEIDRELLRSTSRCQTCNLSVALAVTNTRPSSDRRMLFTPEAAGDEVSNTSLVSAWRNCVLPRAGDGNLFAVPHERQRAARCGSSRSKRSSSCQSLTVHRPDREGRRAGPAPKRRPSGLKTTVAAEFQRRDKFAGLRIPNHRMIPSADAEAGDGQFTIGLRVNRPAPVGLPGVRRLG